VNYPDPIIKNKTLKKPDPSPAFSIVIPFLAGIIPSEIMAFLLIRSQGMELKEMLSNLRLASHQVVPSQVTAQSLDKFATVFCSAQFLVLTIGLLITGLAVVTGWVILGLFNSRKRTRARKIAFFVLWLIFVLLPSYFFGLSQGWKAMLFTGSVSLFVFCAMLIFQKRSTTGPGGNSHLRPLISFILALCISAAVLFSQADQGIFLRVRDHLLFGNPTGEAVISFYYEYTPLAARTIQSPMQKIIKPCWISPELPRKKALERVLRKFGWLAVDRPEDARLILNRASSKEKIPPGTDGTDDNPLPSDDLVFFSVQTDHLTQIFNLSARPEGPEKSGGQEDQEQLQQKDPGRTQILLSVDARKFMASPRPVLEVVSKKLDTGLGLRKLCSLGLLFALPLFTFYLVFILLNTGLGLVLPRRFRAPAAGALTALLPMILIYTVTLPMLPARDAPGNAHKGEPLTAQKSVSPIPLEEAPWKAPLDRIRSLFYHNFKDKFSVRENRVQNLKAYLLSKNSKVRVDALRIVCQNKLNIWNFPGATHGLQRGTAPERYWLANALARAKGKKSRELLFLLARDRALNVRCAALRALSHISCAPKTLKLFQKRMRASPSWYEQQYAWKAFERCWRRFPGRHIP